MKKEDIESKLNEFFGFEVDWRRLPKSDLEKLYEFVKDPENVLKRLLQILGFDEFVEVIGGLLAKEVLHKKPLRNFLEKIFT